MKTKIILFSILILAFILRSWKVDSIPPGINRDEASLGYTAYSILKTGNDEYGVKLPLSIKSFGDWKLPLYAYLDILPVKLLSLNEFSTRFPSIIFGVVTVGLAYFLTKKILEGNQNLSAIPLIASFLLAVSPWHMHFSRVASEANISVFLVTLAATVFFYGMNSYFYLFISSLVLSLSLYTYHSSHIITPLFLIAFIYILRMEKKKLMHVAVFIIPVIILGSFIYSKTLFSADKTKISGLSPLSDVSMIYTKIAIPRLDHPAPQSFTALIFHNKPFYIIESILNGYIRSFSPEFLFIQGGGNKQHNIPDFGNLMLWEAPFILLGMYFIFKYSLKWRYFILFWLLISPIPAAITRDAPHSARMLSILPLPHIISAFGFGIVIRLISGGIKRNYFIIFVSILFIINFSVFSDRYFIHFPKVYEAYWGAGYKALFSDISSRTENYDEIVMDRPNYSPYIYYLYYSKTDPEFFQNNVVRYPEDSEGFQHVKNIGNITFKSIDWADDLLVPGRLLISWVESTPASATHSAILADSGVLKRIEAKYGKNIDLKQGDMIINRLIGVIKLGNGQPQFNLIEVNKISN